MKYNWPELGQLLAKQNIVAKTRKIHSSHFMRNCIDGYLMIHVDLANRYDGIDFKNMTVDEAEKAMAHADKLWKEIHGEET